MSIYFTKTYQRSIGTYPLRGEQLEASLRNAVKIGYRAIDTAQMYQNEADVGACIAGLDVPRDELCITTKVHPDNFDEAKFIPSVEQSLKDLQLDTVDVLLLHWPPVGGVIEPSLRQLQRAHDLGLARHIGISNYNAQMMHDAAQIIDAPLACNQVEFHPLLNQSVLLKAANATGIPLAAYCAVARGKVVDVPLLAALGRHYDKTATQIALRWILQHGVSFNAMSSRTENLQANFDVMDFTLSSVDMAAVDTLGTADRRIVSKDLVPWAPDWD